MNTTWKYLRGKRIAVLAALGCALWGAYANAAVSVSVDAQPTSDPIRVTVSVTNSSGGAVTGLSASDFTLAVDNNAVSTFDFSAPGVANHVSVVFAMDMSSSVQSVALQPMQDAITEFINSMQNGDYAAVVKFNNTNPSKASVVQAFTQIDNGAGTSALVSAVNAPYSGSGSNIFDGTKLAVDQFTSATLPEGPKAVVLVSDGRDNASTTTQDAVINDAVTQNVPIYTIGVGDVTTSGLKTLQALADGTGGQYIAAPTSSQITDAYRKIKNLLNNQYLLSFTSSITDCGSHKLTVTVSNQSPVDQNFQRCTSSGGGGGGGGGSSGGGGGGGASGVPELVVLASAAYALMRRRRRHGPQAG